MKTKRILTKISGFLILTIFLLVDPAQAVEIKGVTFADRYQIEQTRLELKGTAVLKWALLFDVYAGAFYLPPMIAGSEWADDVPKRLELSYFRNFKAEDFSSSSDKLLRDNLAEDAYQTLQERLQQFYLLFRNIKPGDRYSLTYRPETGTELRLNEELLGAAPGADFAVAYFGIWVGPQPINEGFRDRILGGG